MEPLGDELLPHARLTEDEDVDGAGGHAIDQLVERDHRRIADDACAAVRRRATSRRRRDGRRRKTDSRQSPRLFPLGLEIRRARRRRGHLARLDHHQHGADVERLPWMHDSACSDVDPLLTHPRPVDAPQVLQLETALTDVQHGVTTG